MIENENLESALDENSLPNFESNLKVNYSEGINKALLINRSLLMKNFIIPNRLKFPLFRNILENYFQ